MADFSHIRLPASVLAVSAMLNAQTAPKPVTQEAAPELSAVQGNEKAARENRMALEERYADILKSNDAGRLDNVLHEAVKKKDKESVVFLLEKGASPNSVGSDKKTFPLMLAVEANDTEMARLLISKNANPNQRIEYEGIPGRAATMTITPPLLHTARTKGMTELLLSFGADVKETNGGGVTALHSACGGGNFEKIEALLGRGHAKELINVPASEGVTPMGVLTRYPPSSTEMKPYIDAMVLLTASGASINDATAKQTPLITALELRNLDLTKKVLELGADHDLVIEGRLPQAGKRYAALHVFASQSSFDLRAGKILVEKGANLEVLNSEGETPLEVALRSGNKDKVEFLLAHGAKLDMQKLGPRWEKLEAQYRAGQSAVEDAILEHKLQGRRGLITLPEVEIDERQYAAARFALDVASGAVKPVDRTEQSRIERELSREEPDEPKKTNVVLEPKYENTNKDALYDAVRSNDLPTARKLLREEADVQRRYKIGQDENVSLLHAAAQTGGAEMINLLVDNGVNVNTRDSRGLTPIMHAAQSGNASALTALAAKGANPNPAFKVQSKNDTGIENGQVNIAHMAVESGDLATVKAAIKAGADLNARDSAGRRPVDLALEHMKRGEIDQAVIAGAISASMKPEQMNKGSPSSPSPTPARPLSNDQRLHR